MAAAIMMAGSMWAQKDVTSTYITNAKLSDGTNGWTVVNFNTPKKGNNTEGYASESYAGWDALEKTEYSMTQKITLPAGNYTLVNYSFYREGQNADTDAATSRAVLKAGDKSVAIKTLGSITAGGYANSQAEGANVFDSKMYRNALDFKIDADGTEIEIGITGTFTVMRSWIIAGMFELINNDIEATMDSPFDVTGYITNPGFEYRDMTGWTLSESGAFGTQNNNQSFKRGGYYAEKWQSAASGALTARSMSQTLSGLKAGYYQLKVNLGGNGTYVDLNGKTANWTEDKDYTVGYVLSENEDLTITAGKTAEGTANWIHFDNFRLYYCGDVTKALTDVLAKVTEYKDVIPTAAYTKLQSDVAAYDKSYSDVDELLAAIGAVQALYDAADVMKTPYATAKNLVTTAQTLAASYPKLVANATAMNMAIEAATDVATLNECISKMNVAITIFNEWLAVKASAEKLAAVPNDNPAANTGFVNTIAKKEADVQAVSDLSDAAVIGTTTNQLKSEILNYVADANPTGDNKFDLTFLLTNPDVTEFWKGDDNGGIGGDPNNHAAWNVHPEGWFTDQEGGNFQVMTNSDMGPGGEVFIEYWSENPKANDKFVLYQKLNLSEGTYKMEGRLGAQQPIDGSTSGIYFAANDVLGTNIAQGPLSDASIEFVQAAEGEVKIGMKAMTGNCLRWTGINKIKLYKVAPKSYEIAETANYDASTEGAGDVKVTRNIKAGYNTLVLPFSLTQEEVETAFGAGSKVYEISKYENENISFAVRSGIVANEPVILYATAAGTEYTFPGRTVVATSAPVKTVDEVKFVGNYETGYAVAKDVNNYILSDGKFYLVTTDVTLKTTRAFITVPASAPVAARLNITFEDGDATAIDQIATESTTVKGIYNLQGQQLNSLQRGINIVNGKKVLVK